MSFNLQAFPTQNNDYELTTLDDEIILFSVSQEKAVYLNHTAQLIWQLCDGRKSISELVGFLQESYPEEKNIDQQIITAISQMVDDAVLVLSSHSHA